MIGRRLSAGLAACALLCLGSAPLAAQPPSSQPWLRVEWDDLVLISQVPEADLRPVILRLEALRQVIEQTTTLVALSPVPVYVFVFRDEGTLLPYRHRYAGAPALLSGAFYPGPHADFLTVSLEEIGPMNRGAPVQQGITTAAHEYVHALLYSQLPGAPLWLEEGLAELFGALDLVDAKGDCGIHRPCEPRSLRAVLGRPVAAHVGELRDLQPRLDLVGLMSLDPESPEYHEFDAQQTFYARAWALAHHLVLGPEARRRQVWNLVARVGASGTRQDVSRELGLPEGELDGEVLRHFGLAPAGTRTDTAPWQPLELEVAGYPAGLSSRRLDFDELVTLLGELLVVEGRPDAAVEHFELALRTNPQNARALAGSGFAAERSGDWSRARALYGDAQRAAPDDPLLAFRYATSLLVFGRATGQAKLAEAAQQLSRSTALEPRLAPAWAALLDAHELASDKAQTDLVYGRLRAADPRVALRVLLHYVRQLRAQSAGQLIERVISTDGAAQQRAAREAVEHLSWLHQARPPETDLIRP